MKITDEDIEDFKNLKVTEVYVLNDEDYDSFVKTLDEHPFEKNEKVQELLKRKPIWEVEGEGESSFTDFLKNDTDWRDVVSD